MKKRKAGAKKPAKSPEAVSENGLTALQERFCWEFAGLHGACNQKTAATRAGYSEKTAEAQASRLLRNVKVRSRVCECRAELRAQAVITKDYVMLELVDCVAKCKAAVEVMVWDEEERCLKPSGLWQFDSKGALTALDKIGKELGMFRDDKTITVQKPVVIGGADQLAD